MKSHTVEDGECLVSIAKKYEFNSWRQIYFDSCNEDFRRLRPDPFTLKKGDTVNIPGRQVLERSCATGALHVFTCKTRDLAAMVHIRFDVSNVERYAEKPYELTVQGEKLTGTTGTDSQLHHAVPIDALDGELKIWVDGEEEDPEEWSLKLGHMDPENTVSGMQDRLINLGYLGPADKHATSLEDDIRNAMQEFQRAEELDVTDEETSATQIALGDEGRPQLNRRDEYLDVGRRLKLQLKPRLTTIAIRFSVADARDYANRPFEIEADGVIYKGRTNEDAELSIEVPQSVEEAVLRIELEDSGENEGSEDSEEWDLKVGELEPVDSETGFQTRLVNMGYLLADDIGDGEKVSAATIVFQTAHGLEPTGTVDTATANRLFALYGQ